MNLITQIKKRFDNVLFKNSAWGAVSNILQNILYSVFFIILARYYSKDNFGSYAIANNMYSLILGFSSLGLGHWFIREMINTEEKKQLTDVFFKTQLLIGIVFYFIHIAVSCLLYSDPLIRSLAILLGINIIFDNIISVIKYLNIAQLEQWKTFILLIVEAGIKCLVGCVLIIYPIHIIWLSVILIFLRLVTLNLFVRFGSSNSIGIRDIIAVKVNWTLIKNIVIKNWAFIIISSLSVLNWKLGTVIVSKYLSVQEVTDYEVSFKLFSVAYILPIIVSQSIYPMLIEKYKIGLKEMSDVYHEAFIPLSLYGLMAFTFTYSYADHLIPWLFGPQYLETAKYCKEMFLVILIFPTIFLQANVMLTIKMEKVDMICNIASVSLNVLICIIGLTFYRSLSVVNYAIFISFIGFHLIQDYMLIRKQVTDFKNVLLFYIVGAALIGIYIFSGQWFYKEIIFPIFWLPALIVIFLYYKRHGFMRSIASKTH